MIIDNLTELIGHTPMLRLNRLTEGLDTRHKKLHEVVVPVASALLNAYDDEYLGIRKKDDGKD